MAIAITCIKKCSYATVQHYKYGQPTDAGNLPLASSEPKIMAQALATLMLLMSGACRRFVLISAVTAPIFDKPSHIHTYSGFDSINNTTVSPRFIPTDLK